MARPTCLKLLHKKTSLGESVEDQCQIHGYTFSKMRHWRTDSMGYTISTQTWSIKFTDKMICEINLFKNYKKYPLYHWKLADSGPPISPDDVIKILNSDWSELPKLMTYYDEKFTPYIVAHEKYKQEIAIFM